MKSAIVYSLSFAIVLSLSACSTDKIPGVYRIDIQQGNDVTQDMINQLTPGMTKNQVAYIMGTPLLIDTFHPNRWDYLYSYQPGGDPREQRRITLLFNDNEELMRIDGDTNEVASRAELPPIESHEKNVVVPLTEKKVGLFSRLFGWLGFGDDDVETIDTVESQKSESEIDQENSSGRF